MTDTKSPPKETTHTISETTSNNQPIKPWYTTGASASHPALRSKWGKKPI